MELHGLHRARFVRALAFAWLFIAATCAAGAQECGSGAPLPRDGFVRAVERNAAAVVQVVVLRTGRDPLEEAQGFEFFQPLQGLPLPGGEGLDRTFSSGFFVDDAGLILASAHAVFDAREIWIVMADGRRLRASVIGLDRRRDVALLKVDVAGVPVVHVAPHPAVYPGQWVIAIGTPFGFDHTVTVGVVSAYPRFLHGSGIALIQSDVVLNPGSSGGPLFDAEGALLGMNTMIYSASGIYAGMSFALPVDELMRVADGLRRRGTLRTGEIGAHNQPLTPDFARAFGLEGTLGTLVIRVDAGGPAARAGLRSGDVILGLAPGERLSHDAIEARLAAAAPGASVHLDVWRDAIVRQVPVEVMRAAAEPPPPITRRRASEEQRLGLVLTMLEKPLQGAAAGLYVDSATGSSLLAGVERGDRILAVNAVLVATVAEFDAALLRTADRGVVALLVARGGTTAFVPVWRSGLTPG